MNNTILITGANRGIGLALTRTYIAGGATVIATCRDPGAAVELQQLAASTGDRLIIIDLDVDSDDSVASAAHTVAARLPHLDILVNMAGIQLAPEAEPLVELDLAVMRRVFETNTLGPVRVAQAFLSLLASSDSPRLVNISSGLASLTNKNDERLYAYSMSKAALNMFSRTLAYELEGRGIPVVAIDPGWVQTDMGGPDAEIAAETSAAAIAVTVAGLTMKHNGSFLHYSGEPLPW